MQLFSRRDVKPPVTPAVGAEGCLPYSSHLNVAPFSLGEANLVQAALDEGLVVQALHLTTSFSSSCKIYPEPARVLELLAECIELGNRHLVSVDKSTSPHPDEGSLAPENSKPAVHPPKQALRSQVASSPGSGNVELGEALVGLARLLNLLSSYLDPPYFVEVFRPLVDPTHLFKRGKASKGHLVATNLWAWVECLGKLQRGGSGASPTLAIASGQLLAALVSILHDDIKYNGWGRLELTILVRLLPGAGLFPSSKLEAVIDGLRWCDFANAFGSPWVLAMFHLHHLLVLLSHANVVSAYTLLALSYTHYHRLDALASRRRFLRRVISLPFKCQLIDFALRADFAPLYDGRAGGWFGWARLNAVYLKVPFTQLLDVIVRRVAPKAKIHPRVRVTRSSRQLDSETAHRVHQDVVYLLSLEDASPIGSHTPMEPTDASLKAALATLATSLPPVERFLSAHLRFPPCLTELFDALLVDFAFPTVAFDPTDGC
ncbi:hypothetical protein L0F63_007441 [Massospora cicadina]|nr:hypothetical protein L0F63_007441 [Massospora cicadina]